MRIHALGLEGAYVFEPEPVEDERGCFARVWDRAAAADHGLLVDFAQASIAFNARRGTLRGLHWQAAPHAETKLVRCTRGAAYDVIVDLRAGAPRWEAVELSEANRRTLYVPPGFAHGYLTLADATELAYQIAPAYTPGSARGARYDDPAFGITWPFEPVVIAARDLGFGPWQEAP